MSDSFDISDAPELHDPILIGAFKGWNDAGEAASSSIRHLTREWSATHLGHLDGEEFYDYTEVRPTVRYVNGDSRELEWPSLDLFLHRAAERDIVLMVGHEPQLRWPTFARTLVHTFELLRVRQVVLIGSLLADVPHTRATPLFGSASTRALRGQLDALQVGLSRYEGPTGIIGILQDVCGRAGLSTASLWGNVPHYITASPNPQVSVTLLQVVSDLLALDLDLHGLEAQAKRFQDRVDEAIAQSPEATRYVQELEEHEGDGDESPPDRSPLPTGPEVVRALEEFLRRQRTDDDE